MPLNKLLILAACALFALCLALNQAAPAQDKEQKKKVDEDLTEVRFNLSVIGGEGKPVDGLKAGHIKIFENDVEQKITYFVKKEPVLDLGLVADNSYSLGSQLSLVKNLTKWFVDNLQGKDEAFVIGFVNSERIAVVAEWGSDKAAIFKAIDDNMFVSGGSTSVIDALYLSAEKMLLRPNADKNARSALILISDCEDRNSFYKLKDLFAKTEGTDLQIFVIGMVSQLDKNSMATRSSPQEKAIKLAQRVAAKTGGVAYFPETDKEKRYIMTPSAEAIVRDLSSQYIVGYVPQYKKTDDKKEICGWKLPTAEKVRKDLRR